LYKRDDHLNKTIEQRATSGLLLTSVLAVLAVYPLVGVFEPEQGRERKGKGKESKDHATRRRTKRHHIPSPPKPRRNPPQRFGCVFFLGSQLSNPLGNPRKKDKTRVITGTKTTKLKTQEKTQRRAVGETETGKPRDPCVLRPPRTGKER
jgi:hypothetical protein